MDNDPNQQLEHLIQRELEKLPELSAPNALIPRVLAAIEAQAQAPAWKRSWWTWPLGLKTAFVAVLLTLVGVFLYGSSWASAQWQTSAAPQNIGHWWDAFASTGEVLATLGHALLVVCRSIGQPWLLGLAGLVMVMYLTCVGLGTICFRVAVNKR
jgi:hypothetical protein